MSKEEIKKTSFDNYNIVVLFHQNKFIVHFCVYVFEEFFLTKKKNGSNFCLKN